MLQASAYLQLYMVYVAYSSNNKMQNLLAIAATAALSHGWLHTSNEHKRLQDCRSSLYLYVFTLVMVLVTCRGLYSFHVILVPVYIVGLVMHSRNLLNTSAAICF